MHLQSARANLIRTSRTYLPGSAIQGIDTLGIDRSRLERKTNQPRPVARFFSTSVTDIRL